VNLYVTLFEEFSILSSDFHLAILFLVMQFILTGLTVYCDSLLNADSPLLFSLLQAGPLAAYYKLPLHRVLVVSVYVLIIFLGATLYGGLTSLLYEFQAYDDTDLPCGVLRLQPKGGYGRHNGLVNLTVVCLVIFSICVSKVYKGKTMCTSVLFKSTNRKVAGL
jgi:hypothetical protein